MKHSSLLTSPKMEEHPLPDDNIDENPESNSLPAEKETSYMHELDSILGFENEKNWPHDDMYGERDWDFQGWNSLSIYGDEDNEQKVEFSSMVCEKESHISIKKENYELWDEDDDDNKSSLNLSLNHQKVLDEWSDRGTLWADDNMLSTANNDYMGEVPVMEEERTTRREASVLRYKEKRQTRLFSKKIRYQVRKLNADKRPRLKGRFVKRVPETTLK